MRFSARDFLDSILNEGRIEIYAKRTHALRHLLMANQKKIPRAVFRGFGERRTRICDLLSAEKRELNIPDDASPLAVVYDPLFTSYERLSEELKAEFFLDPYVVTRTLRDMFLVGEDDDHDQFKTLLSSFIETDLVGTPVSEIEYDLILVTRTLHIAHEAYLSGCRTAHDGGRPLTRAREFDEKLLKHYVDRVKSVLEWVRSLLNQ